MKKYKKMLVFFGLIALTIGTLTFDTKDDIYAKTSAELRKEQDAAKKELEQLEKQKKEMENQLGGMQSELTQVSNEVAELNGSIRNLEEEITITEVELEEAEAKASKQYDQMKQRIQFMYENSMNTESSFLFASRSISEFLNRAEYISSLTNYDRNLLDSYIKTRNDIATTKQKLEENKQTLTAKQTELQQKENSLLTSIAGKKDSISSATGSIGAQENKVKDLQKEIDKMIAYENSLKEAWGLNKPDVSNQVKRSLIQREQSMPTWGRIVTPRDGEESLLAAIIYCEAGGEPYAGQLAVGTVVLNRVNSQFFPNTITDVIYSPRQFTPAESGRLAYVIANGLTTDSCRRAAREVLEGNFTGTWLYFCTVRPSVTGDLIGHQVFY